MSIKMKKYYYGEKNDNVNEILELNGIEDFNNAFELIYKNVERFTKQCNDNMDFVLMKATMTSLTGKISNSSVTVSKNKSKKYIVIFVNIKNQEGDNFSSFIETLNENDKIIIIDGVILSNNTAFENNTLTVAVRLENKSSVFLVKYEYSHIHKTDLSTKKNLSKMTCSGLYSLVGFVKKIIKCTDQEYMLLRIQCHDKCCIKIHKYPHSVYETKNITNEEIKHGMEYDFFSNEVDILIKSPSINFISLEPNQQIHLNNVKVSYSFVTHIFALYLKGRVENLKTHPIQTINVNPLRSPKKIYFPLPDDLRPISKPKRKYDTISNNQLNDHSNKYKKLNQFSHSNTNFPLNIKGSEYSTKMSKSNNVNVSSCNTIIASQLVLHKNIDNNDTNIVISDRYTNNELTTVNQPNEEHNNIFNDKQLNNESNKCKEFSEINNLSTNIEANDSNELTNMSSNDNVNVSPCKDFLGSRHVLNKNMDNNDTNIVISDLYTNNTNNNELTTVNQPNEEHNNISNDKQLNNELNKCKEFSEINNLSTNIEANDSNELTNMSSNDNVNVSPCKDFLRSRHVLNKNMDKNDTNIVISDLYTNNTNNNELTTVIQPNEEHNNISNDKQLNNESNKCKEFSEINNLSTNIEANNSNKLTNMSSNDNVNVSPHKEFLASQQVHNNNQKDDINYSSQGTNNENFLISNNLNMPNENNYLEKIKNDSGKDNSPYNLYTNDSCSPPFLTSITSELKAVGIPKTQSNTDNLNNVNSTIPKFNKTIMMKTYYFEIDNNINEILNFNEMGDFNNAFELIFKNVERCTKKCNYNMDFVLMKATMTSLTKKISNSSITLSRGKNQKYIIIFVNIKNEKEENFSSFVDTLCTNDKIIIIDGVILKNNTTFENNTLTVAVRLENKSSVILFKSLMNSINLVVEKNLSNITGSGIHSLFGFVKKIIKYTDQDYMLLRIQCHDKCCIKIRKYPHSVCEVKNIENADLKYDFFSNQVDIIVRKPSSNFMSLKPNQQIFLNNVKVSYSSASNTFSLYLKGMEENLKSDPIDIDNDIQLNNESNKYLIDHQFTNDDNETDDEMTLIHSSCLPFTMTVSNKSTSLMTSTTSTLIQSDIVNLTNVKSTSQKKYIDLCRIINTDPNIYTSEDCQDFISGYCPKCCSFFVKSLLMKLNMEYRCPECSTTVYLKFFFKMSFIYGKNESRFIEVCCYGDNAEFIIKKLSKVKSLTLENYLLDQKYRILLSNTIKSLIANRTKMKIIICDSSIDNTTLLLGVEE